ncbi:hypothetical protein JCM6882_006741 [Rhodosporidiobolus microsporus]
MQPYAPYSLTPFGRTAAGDGDISMSDAVLPPPSNPYVPFGSSSAMLTSGHPAGLAPAPDPLEASYGPSFGSPTPYPSASSTYEVPAPPAFSPSLTQHPYHHQQQHQHQHHPSLDSPTHAPAYANSPTASEGDYRRMSREEQVETDMLQQSGLGAFDGVPMSPSLPQYAYGAGGGEGGVVPARSLSYTAGETFSAYGSGGGGGGGRPVFGRAETYAGPLGGTGGGGGGGGGGDPYVDPFTRLRAGAISITPSAPSPALSPAVKNRLGAGNGILPTPTLSSPAPAPPQPSIPYPSYDVSNPVYDLYGSSFSAVPPHQQSQHRGGRLPLHPAPSGGAAAAAMSASLSSASAALVDKRDPSPPHAMPNPAAFSTNPTAPSDAFDPAALGLPMPPPRAAGGATTTNAYQNIYSSSGFDLVGVLARVANRRRPTIQIGAIDMSCSFVVVDAKRFDQPIVYASETFSRLTGYSNEEIVGRNCRFLQAPGDVVVQQGEKRRYTDGNAAFHLRKHLVLGEDTQVSLINYHKGGKPFINLVTVIPITWDAGSSEVDFFVGFQVDLIDQPAAILDKMQNGSYVIDYSVVMGTINRNPSITSGGAHDFASAMDALEDAAQHAASHSATQAVVKAGSAQMAREQLRADSPDEVVDLVRSNPKGAAGLPNEALKKQFHRLLVDECDDLIHVVSLKGALLYVSAASRRHLEYEPSELLGKPLASFCHPSDIVSVQRELKDAGVAVNPTVNLVFRIRRKQSGYVWWQAQGRLHLEPGKGRKCVILSGRPSEIMRMSWRDLEAQGGMSESPADEFFAKICTDAIFLVATQSAEKILRVKNVADAVQGKSVGDLSPPGTDDAQRVMDALLDAAGGNPSKVQHRLRRGDGSFVEVVTRFFPSRSEEDHDANKPAVEGQSSAPAVTTAAGKNVSVVAQISLLDSEDKRRQRKLRTPPPASSVSGDSTAATVGGSVAPSTTKATSSVMTAATTACASSAGVSITAPIVAAASPGMGPAALTTFSAVPSMFKTLDQPGATSDNVFNELDVTRGTSWQFELHQMRLINKKLREEREALVEMRKKKAALAQAPPAPVNKNGSGLPQKSCANCGRTSSAEWRSGPTGPKTLCNACGLRWSKAKSQAAAKERKAKEQENVRLASERAEAAAAATRAAAALVRPPLDTGSSSEAQSRSGSRDTNGSGSGGDSTDPTTVSPSPVLPAYSNSPCVYGSGSGVGQPESSQPPSLNGSPMPLYPMGGAYAVPQPKPVHRPPMMHSASSTMSASYGAMYPPASHPPPPTGAGPPPPGS